MSNMEKEHTTACHCYIYQTEHKEERGICYGAREMSDFQHQGASFPIFEDPHRVLHVPSSHLIQRSSFGVSSTMSSVGQWGPFFGGTSSSGSFARPGVAGGAAFLAGGAGGSDESAACWSFGGFFFGGKNLVKRRCKSG